MARDGARLADELRGLDSANLAAVASYNARSASTTAACTTTTAASPT